MTAVNLEDVLTTPELDFRASRKPDYEAENRALVAVAEEMAMRPGHILQKLADIILDVCHCDSAGVSILEPSEGGDIFRWHGTAGLFGSMIGGTMPRNASPCGVVLDRDSVALFSHPERFFLAAAALDPPIEEILLVPFHVDGRPAGTLWAIAHNAARRFDAEDSRILKSLSQLASAGFQLYASLETAQRASLAKSQFLATMSHELRTPLTGVIGFSNLLETDVVGSTSGPQKEMLARIQTSSWHLVGIIDEILTFSRAESGKLEVHATATDLVEVAREVLRIVEPQANDHGLRLSLEETGERLEISTDRGKVRQILINLVGNAVKYTPTGSVTVLIDTTESDWAAVHVSDTGPGIGAHLRELIFEPFTQVDGSHTRATGGAGLGLAICRRLAELIGGEVTLESTIGAGSTFTLRLPKTR